MAGKFARLAVIVDLTKPLTSKNMVDGEMIYVEYEGLPTICYHRGRYGHLLDSCPKKIVVLPDTCEARSQMQPEHEKPEVNVAREKASFGEWMVVQC